MEWSISLLRHFKIQTLLKIGSLSKLTRRPRGGGQQVNFYSEGPKAKWIHSALDIIHSLIEWKFECDRLLSAAASVCLSSLKNCCMAAISAFRVTQHSQIFHFSLEIEFNPLRFIDYTIPRLCSTYAVATIGLRDSIITLRSYVNQA